MGEAALLSFFPVSGILEKNINGENPQSRETEPKKKGEHQTEQYVSKSGVHKSAVITSFLEISMTTLIKYAI